MLKHTLLFPLLLLSAALPAQQVPDTSRFFEIGAPHYSPGSGPVVKIDAAHNNFHTLDGRYRAFGNVLEADGYRLASLDEAFSPESLKGAGILAVSNALHTSNTESWALPTPSAFTPEEIAVVRQWVADGGRLFLIADHMPFAGAAQELGRAFGFEYLNCFAMDGRNRSIEYFTRQAGSLYSNAVTEGAGGRQAVDSIVTFTGSAFMIPESAAPVLGLDERYTLLLPQQAWTFTQDTPYVPGAGYYQLAYRQYGKGKVVVSGEAAMFSAQLAGPNHLPMGMNNPAASRNVQLLLNIMHWLAE
ncbi:MAG: DUF4350 domain-containing protein [Phaeodactylibacter sp.]|nr:DUF4350 domain-containing protein [Phaeodactylibacter sp.]MCB9276405.1 DUF4350 domain-containing protein [Lewinellaceae bacterium]